MRSDVFDPRSVAVLHRGRDGYGFGSAEIPGDVGSSSQMPDREESKGTSVWLGDRRTVLVADDETHIVDFLAMLLQDEGCRVLCAFDGVHAWELWEEHHPDLIISDVMMPGLTGLDLARRIKLAHNGSSPPIVLMSAVTGFVAMDGVQFLLKPFDIEQILSIVDHLNFDPRPS